MPYAACKELLNFLNIVKSGQPILADNFSVLEERIRALYQAGRKEMQPGRFERFSNLQSIIKDQSKTKSNQDLAQSTLRLVLECFAEEWQPVFLTMLNAQVCRNHLQALKNDSDAPETSRKLLKSIHSLILHRNTDASAEKYPALFLCFSQVLKNLPLLIDGLKKSCALIVSYVSHCLDECFEKIQKEPWEPLRLPCSEFLNFMDTALGHLDDIAERPSETNAKSLKLLKEIVNELLCHSMSAAHVAVYETDKQTIMGKAQSILKALEELEDHVAGEDFNLIRLTANDVSDSLCALERTVNSTVLRLVLYITSRPSNPLRDIVVACQPCKEIPSSRKASDLDCFIAEFDAYLDRLIQVGSFAISCTSDVRKAVRLRSCLASFEALGAELVPCCTSVYLNITGENKRSLRMLVDQWMKEFTEFRNVLNSILDPAAYTEVVKNCIEEGVKRMTSEEVAVSEIKGMINAVETLQGVTDVCLEQESRDEDRIKLQKLMKSVKDAKKRCEFVVAKLEEGQQKETLPVQKCIACLKRSVDEVWERLAEQVIRLEETSSIGEIGEKTNENLCATPKKQYYQLCPVERAEYSNKIDVTPYITRGHQFVKEVVFYNTPKRIAVSRTPHLLTPKIRTVSFLVTGTGRTRCFRSAKATSDRKDAADDTELTALLDNLSQLDDTFSLRIATKRKQSDFKGRQLLELFEGWDGPQEASKGNDQLTSSTLTSCNSVGTLTRLEDIHKVEEKIATLTGPK